LIKVENLTRKYGDFTAVDNASFSLPRGQVVGLLGHNGAGKTTIMKMLTGYLEPTEGAAWVADMNVAENRLAVQRKIGYLPESSPLYPEMSVIQYLEYVCRLRSVPAADVPARIKAAVQRTGLRSVALNLIQTLSKGFKQRLGVAQAIIHEPEILILDEPTSGLDPSQIQEMRGLIRELSQKSTVILSTHILQEVEAECDRVIIMLRGKIAADALLSQLRSSQRLVMGIESGPAGVEGALKRVAGVKEVKLQGTALKRSEYLIEVDQEGEAVLPLIAGAAVAQGWKLIKLDREQKTLEAIFREVDGGMSGGRDGR
jgi:ABC-2 type transport system ATP-binding protein